MKPLSIFVPSAAAVVTDHRGHGEGLIAWRVLAGLARRGHELIVCAREVDLHAEPPFRVVEIGRASSFESVEPLAYARAVGRALASLGGPARFDVAHWIFPQAAAEAVWTPPAGLPLVVGPRFPEWPGGRGRPLRPGDGVRALASPLFRARSRRLLAAASTILLANPDAAATVPAELLAAARVLPIGVDAYAFRPGPLPGAPTVLFVGRLERPKGVRELIPAFARARATVGDATLLVAGEGPDRAWIEAEARRLGFGRSLVLLGPVAHADVPRLLTQSSLVCLPSHGEPYGMAVLEAMAAGRAVVATEAGGPRYLLDRRGGRLVPPGDADALARALTDLVGDREALAEMGRFNRARVERELSLDRMLDALESLYSDVTREATAA